MNLTDIQGSYVKVAVFCQRLKLCDLNIMNKDLKKIRLSHKSNNTTIKIRASFHSYGIPKAVMIKWKLFTYYSKRQESERQNDTTNQY